MSGMMATLLSLAMLASVALVIGGVVQARRGGADRRRGWLMIVCAAVIFANVLIVSV